MHNFSTFILWALATFILWDASFAKDQSGYVCLIEEPKKNQCDSICLTELIPRLNEVVKAQNEGNTITRNAVNDIKSKLEALEVKIGEVQAKLPQEVFAKLEGRLQGVEAKMERQFQEMLTKLEGQQTKMEAKLGESLLAVQTKLETKLQAVLNTLQAVSNKVDPASQQAVPASATITIPSGFERIGSRYFRIVKEEFADWETAERKCREMGGYLASFRNEEEIKAITQKIRNSFYWLGINDQGNGYTQGYKKYKLNKY